MSLDIIVDRSFMFDSLSIHKRFRSASRRLYRVDWCPSIHLVVTTAEDYNLERAVEFNKKSVLPFFRLEAEFVDPLIAYHLVPITRPFEMVSTLPSIFEG